MDPLTHGLLGAASGYAAFGRRLGPRAAAIGAVAALAPDLDALIRSEHQPLLYVEYHRQFTHSLLFAPVGAAVVSLIWSVRQRSRSDWALVFTCALLGWWSHALLDASTTYGTELLWPIRDHRFAWNLVSIVDPLVTLALAVCLLAGLRRQSRRIVATGLAFALLYLTAGAVQHGRAAAAQRLLAAERGHVIERAEVMPTLGNQLVWRTLYEHRGRIHSDRVRAGWLSRPTVCEGSSLEKETPETLQPFERERNDGHRALERFARFSNGWVARAPFDPEVFGDMRYSLSAGEFDPVWGIRFTEPGAPTNYVWINRSRDRDLEFGRLWEEIRGRDPCYREPGRWKPSSGLGSSRDRPRG